MDDLHKLRLFYILVGYYYSYIKNLQWGMNVEGYRFTSCLGRTGLFYGGEVQLC